MFDKQKAAYWTQRTHLLRPDVYECSACRYEACEKVVKEPVPLSTATVESPHSVSEYIEIDTIPTTCGAIATLLGYIADGITE